MFIFCFVHYKQRKYDSANFFKRNNKLYKYKKGMPAIPPGGITDIPPEGSSAIPPESSLSNPSPSNGLPALCPQYGTAWERRTINSNILQMGQIIKVKLKPAG